MKKQFFTSFILLVLALTFSPETIAQTFSPSTYSGWLTTPDNYFGVVPAAPGVTFTQISRESETSFQPQRMELIPGNGRMPMPVQRSQMNAILPLQELQIMPLPLQSTVYFLSWAEQVQDPILVCYNTKPHLPVIHTFR